VLLLQQKRADAGIEDAVLLDYLASRNPQLTTLPGLYANAPIGIALAKGDPALLKLVNGFVADYIKSGAYAANYKKMVGRAICATGAAAMTGAPPGISHILKGKNGFADMA
jgi:polar amino acid transport system substrate-binding protein